MGMTIIFDGRAQAESELEILKQRVAASGRVISIGSFYFGQDKASGLYTTIKRRAAQRVGIEFMAWERDLGEDWQVTQAAIQAAVEEKNAIGIIVQKPTKKCYNDYFLSIGKQPALDYDEWWRKLVTVIPVERDVDALSEKVQAMIRRGEEVKVLPATVRAVLKCLADVDVVGQKVLIIGKSDLLGEPLYWWGRNHGWEVEIVGKQDLRRLLAKKEQLRAYRVIVSATGQRGLIRREMIADGVILVDVGEPHGDVDRASCEGKAAMITPVPGGVGPLTVVSLLENSLICSELDGEL